MCGRYGYPAPRAVLAFIWIDIPACLRRREHSAGNPRLAGRRRLPRLHCPRLALPVRLLQPAGRASADRSTVAALSGSIMRKM